MFEYMQGNVTDMVRKFFWFDKITYVLDICNADDSKAPYGRRDVRTFITKLDGPNRFNKVQWQW